MTPKFSVGQHVNHPACPDGTFPAGQGIVMSVVPGKNQDSTYKVKCDYTGKVLSHDFKESELSAA